MSWIDSKCAFSESRATSRALRPLSFHGSILDYWIQDPMLVIIKIVN